jgi:predicted ATPase
MKLQKLHIKNFKSIVDLEIVEPNPFTVFVGPNGSGKSNIFEALEFWNLGHRFSDSESIVSMFGGTNSIVHFNFPSTNSEIIVNVGRYKITAHSNATLMRKYDFGYAADERINWDNWVRKSEEYKLFIENFSRIFVAHEEIEKLRLGGNSKLSLSASNLEGVLKRVLANTKKREEILGWLELFIPGFTNVEIVSSELSSLDTLVMYDKSFTKPFTKDLLSDGTFNTLALLTAVYQADKPQFLCLEEPENGLHPQVIRELVTFFREACQNGHYIWLNTHSQTLVDCLTTDEIILVDKIKGETQVKQLKGRSLSNLPASELWLSGALGGGVTW